MKHPSLAILTLAFFVVGCSKEGAPGSSAGASSSTGSTGSPAGGCSAGAYTHKNPEFCIQTPEGFTAGSDEVRGGIARVELTGPQGKAIVLSWVPIDRFDDELQGMKALAKPADGDTSLGSGELPGGGFFYHTKFKGETHQAEVLVKGKTHALRCYVNTSQEMADKLLAACKTLRGT